MATLGSAVPGLVLAVALMVPLTTFDKNLALLMRDYLGWQPRLLITGTVAGLVVVYVARFGPWLSTVSNLVWPKFILNLTLQPAVWVHRPRGFGQSPCAAVASGGARRLSPSIHRCDERTAGHLNSAPIQLRNLGDLGLSLCLGRTAVPSCPSRATDRLDQFDPTVVLVQVRNK